MRNTLGRYLATTALALSLAALAPGADALASSEAKKWSAYIDLEAQGGSRNKGEVNAFIPIMQNRIGLLFLDLRGKLFSEGVPEGNFGVGYRQRMGEGNVGGYGFVDVRRSENDNTFYQITLGAEYLTRGWDLRGNVYVPISEEEEVNPFHKAASSKAEVSPGGNLQLRSTGVQALVEEPLWGVDAEVGVLLTELSDEFDQEVRLFFGGFYFDGDIDDELAGPKARAEYRIFDVMNFGPQSRFTVAAEARWDDVRDEQGVVSATLRIPLQSFVGGGQASRLDALDRRMVDPIERDDDIVTQTTLEDRGELVEDVLNARTGREIKAVEYIDPNGDVVQQVADLGADTVAVVSDGVFDPATTIELQNGQTLLGGGGSLAVRGMKSGFGSNYTAVGTRGQLGNSAATHTIVLAGDNSSVIGVDIVGGTRGIRVAGDNAHVGDVNLMDQVQTGILVDATNSTFRNILIDSPGDVAAVGRQGIFVRGNSSDLTFTDITITDSTNQGIRIGGARNVTVNGLQVTGGINGVSVVNGASNVTLNDVSIANTSGSGVLLDGAMNVSMTNIGINNTGIVSPGTHGIEAINSDFTLMNANIANSNRGQAIQVENSSAKIVDTHIAGAAGNGLTFLVDNGSHRLEIDGLSTSGFIGFSAVRARINNGATGTVTLTNASLAGDYSNALTLDARGGSILDVSGSGNTGVAGRVGTCNVLGANTIVGSVSLNGASCP